MAIKQHQTRYQFFWSGDINPENGGHFYRLDGVEYGYASGVIITPCSDAGGPDNLFWVTPITVNLRTGEELEKILFTVGASTSAMIESGMNARARLHAAIDAHISYGVYDQGCCACVQVGPMDESWSNRGGFDMPRTTVRLRAGACIGNYAKKILREGA